MPDFHATPPMPSIPYGAPPLAGVPAAMPTVPMAFPTPAARLPQTSYQGLLDRLHLASQSTPVALPPILPPLPGSPGTSGLPSLSDLLQGLKDFVARLLEPAVPAPPPPPPVSTPSQSPARKTEFVISSFNVLGSSHTKGAGSDRPGMAPGTTRIRKVAELLERHDVDVVGFQEFQRDQFNEFKNVAGKEFAIYPGVKLGKSEVVNSIAWRKETWDLVKAEHILIPYFDGNQKKMPVVRLRHKVTGQEAYFANFHNPASTKRWGDQEKWRDVATQKQVDLVNRLRRETGLPVFVTGDMNERDEYYEKMTEQTDMTSADTRRDGKPPKSMAIDWIFGTESMVTFMNYLRDRSPLVKKASDHPMIVSKAVIKPPKAG